MRYCHDWEFLETGHELAPISVGIVAEDGREYYAVSADMPIGRILNHKFLMDEVWPHLPTVDMPKGARGEQYILDRAHPDVKPLAQIADEVRAFLLEPGTPVELWADHSAHDHVCLAGMYGPMVQMPEGLPWFTRDIKSEAVRLGNPLLPEQQANAHHALFDARHDWAKLRILEKLDERDRAGRLYGSCPECQLSSRLEWAEDGDDVVVCECGWSGPGAALVVIP